MSETPTDWTRYGLSAKEAVQNAAENFQRLPSAKDFMARSEPMSETPAPYGNSQPSEQQQRVSEEELIQKILDRAQDALNGGDKYWSGEFAIPLYRDGFKDIIELCRNHLNSATGENQ